MSEATDKLNLVERTRERNNSLWVNMDLGGLLTPLDEQQTAENLLAGAGVENTMAVSDEVWDIKGGQRDRTAELERAGVTQDGQIADAKVATGRAKIVIQRAADDYILAAMFRDAKVKSLIMGVKEYAGLVEVEQLAVAEGQAILAVAKEGLRLDQINAQIYYEMIAKAQVEADLAKAKVEVAKANVRALLADIAAGEADIKVIQAETEQYMAEADKATLQADVASIYAEILTKQLSKIKLDVGQKEIAAGFTYIQSHLEDALDLYDTKEATQLILTLAEANLQAEIGQNLVANEAQEALRETEMDNSLETFDYEKARMGVNISNEQYLQNALTNVRLNLLNARTASTIAKDAKDTWGQQLVYAAQVVASTRRNVQRFINSADYTTKTIS
ncbi:MAG: hypothetical protein WC356_02265 [Candidatus Micrarchaeia archaeon]|jgi:hypothetical protein